MRYYVLLDKVDENGAPLDEGTYLAEFNSKEDALNFIEVYNPFVKQLRWCGVLDDKYSWALNWEYDNEEIEGDSVPNFPILLRLRKEVLG